MLKQFYFKQYSFSMSIVFFVYTQLNVKTVLFQTIQFNISTQSSSIGPISGATTPSQSGPGNDGNEGILHILRGSSITGASPSDCLMSYSEHSLEESHLSAEIQSVYSAVKY